MARVFSLKHSSNFVGNVGNVGIYSVGTKSVNQIVQVGKIEYFASVSREGLTHELLAKHNCLPLY